VLLLPAALLLVLFGQPLLGLFGPEYRIGHGVLLFLTVGYFAWAAAALSALWLQYTGRAAAVLTISISTLVVDSALNLLLIPRYGMAAAAAGTALTLTAGAAAIVAVHRWSPVRRAPGPP
jgi:O-antigen/teichoic acid export membrane protein